MRQYVYTGEHKQDRCKTRSDENDCLCLYKQHSLELIWFLRLHIEKLKLTAKDSLAWFLEFHL